jgi:hypothetical protein
MYACIAMTSFCQQGWGPTGNLDIEKAWQARKDLVVDGICNADSLHQDAMTGPADSAPTLHRKGEDISW